MELITYNITMELYRYACIYIYIYIYIYSSAIASDSNFDFLVEFLTPRLKE